MSSENIDYLYLDARRNVLLGLTLVEKCNRDSITDFELKNRKKFLVQNEIVNDDCDLKIICGLNVYEMSNKQIRKNDNRCKDPIKYNQERCDDLDKIYHSDCSFTENYLPKNIKVYYNKLNLDVLKRILKISYAHYQSGNQKILLKCLVGRMKYQNNCLPYTKVEMTEESNLKHQYFIEVLYLSYLLTHSNPEKIFEYITRINSIEFFLNPDNKSKYLYNQKDDNFSSAKELLDDQLKNLDQIMFLCSRINKIVEKNITSDILLQLNLIETEVKNLISLNLELKESQKIQEKKEDSESEEESTYIRKTKGKKSKGKKAKKSDQSEQEIFKELSEKEKIKTKQENIKQEEEAQILKQRVIKLNSLISKIQNSINIGKADIPKIKKLIDFINELPKLSQFELDNKNLISKNKQKIALENFLNLPPPNKKLFERAVNYFNTLIEYSELYFKSPVNYGIFENTYISELDNFFYPISFDLLIYFIVYYLYFFEIKKIDKSLDFNVYSIIPGLVEEKEETSKKESSKEKTGEEKEETSKKESSKEKTAEEIEAEKARQKDIENKYNIFNQNLMSLITGIMLDSYKKEDYTKTLWRYLSEEDKEKLELLRKFINYFLEIKYG